MRVSSLVSSVTLRAATVLTDFGEVRAPGPCPSARSRRRLVGSAHVLGNYCGTVPTQVGHHLHGRTTHSVIRTVGHPRHMCDTVRDGQIGHDFTAAVGKVAEVDST